MATVEFPISIPSHAISFSCSIMRLPRALFVWAGNEPKMGYLSVSVPSRDPSQPPVGSIILQNSSRATQLSSRLTALLGLQVFISGDLADESDFIWTALEDRITEEINTNPTLFQK